MEISFSVTPRDEELDNANSEVKLLKTVQFDLKEEQNTPSTIAARNILTTTPDPSDDEGSSNGSKAVHSNEMEVSKEENAVLNNVILQENVPEVPVNS